MEIEIDAPRGQVFGHLAQPELMKRWVRGLVEFRPLDEGPRLGARAVQTVEIAGSRWELRSQIERYEPPHALDAVLRHPRLELGSSYRLEERDGRTLVRADVEVRAARMVRAVVRGQARRKLKDDLVRLKELLEAAT